MKFALSRLLFLLLWMSISGQSALDQLIYIPDTTGDSVAVAESTVVKENVDISVIMEQQNIVKVEAPKELYINYDSTAPKSYSDEVEASSGVEYHPTFKERHFEEEFQRSAVGVSPLSLSLFGGLNIAFMAGDYIDYLKDTLLHVGATPRGNGGFRIKGHPKEWFGVASGLQVSGKGYRVLLWDTSFTYQSSGWGYSFVDYEAEVYSDYDVTFLEIPIQIFFEKEMQNDHLFYGTVGFAPGFVISAKSKTTAKEKDGNDRNKEEIGTTDHFDPTVLYDENGIYVEASYSELYRVMDISLIMGFGFNLSFNEYVTIFFETLYYHGLIPHANMDDTIKDGLEEIYQQQYVEPEDNFRVFQINLGFQFHFRK